METMIFSKDHFFRLTYRLKTNQLWLYRQQFLAARDTPCQSRVSCPAPAMLRTSGQGVAGQSQPLSLNDGIIVLHGNPSVGNYFTFQ
ncbi:MAG: hypothetical protein ACKO4U_01595 [Caldilinea sp.]